MTQPQQSYWWHPQYPIAAGPIDPPPMQRWIPAAIIAAGIVIAGAVIGGSLGGSGKEAQARAQEESAPRSQTCVEWASTQVELGAIPRLPQGWNWTTPNIDTYIGNLAAAVEKSVSLFEQRITSQPANAASAARIFIEAKRAEMKALRDHSYGSRPSDGTSTDAALARLNQVCGTSGSSS